MALDRIKIRYEDLKKAMEHLEKNESTSFIQLEIVYPKLTIYATDMYRDYYQITLMDEQYYANPKIIKEEKL